MATRKKAKVKFDYLGQEGNYISLQKGSVIDVVNVGTKGGWTKGIELSTGKYLARDFMRCYSIFNFISTFISQQPKEKRDISPPITSSSSRTRLQLAGSRSSHHQRVK